MTKSRLSCACTLALLVLVANLSNAVTLPDFSFDIPSQTIPFHEVAAGLNKEFVVPVSYDIGFTRASGYNVTENIQFTGFDPGPAIRDNWKTSTESIWTTNRFNQPVVVTVNFVQNNPNQVVKVMEGPGRGDAGTWFSGWPQGQASAAPWAHEVGHYLGNFDEYPGGGVNPKGSFGNEPGLMGLGTNGPPGTELTLFDRQYQFVADWAATQGGSVSAPEPATSLLVTSGLAGILFIKRRKRSWSRSRFSFCPISLLLRSDSSWRNGP